MARKARTGELLRSGEVVIAATDLPGIPEGTRGKVIFPEGLTWIRYWVRFDNGVVRGSINRNTIARPTEWLDLKAKRERGETAEATAGGDGAAASDGGGGDGGGGTDGVTVNGVLVPAMLLERSKKRREALGLT
jgi:hypothetical protein